MLPLNGINTDINKAKLSGDFALDILNGVIYKGNIQNEEGFIEHSSYLKDNNLIPLGVQSITNGKKVFICKGEPLDTILILDKDGVFTRIIDLPLNLNLNFPVDIEIQYNHKMELVIAITDGLNTPKIINLDDLPNLSLGLSSIEMFPSFKEPVIQADLAIGSGSLKSGVYQIFIRYVDYDGTVLGASAITNPISIGPSNESDYNSFQGAEAGETTNKGITVTISNVDSNYDKVQICMLEKQSGIIAPKIIREVSVSSIIQYTISGEEDFDDLTIEESITPLIKYKTIKHLTQVDGTLYGASVTEEDFLNLQKYINKTTLTWKSELKNLNEIEESYKVHNNVFYNRTFQHDEVYAFYIRIKLKDGEWTKAFHVPGRPPSAGERDIQPLGNNGMYAGGNLKVYQSEDTTSIISQSGNTISGNFGYWENEDEEYRSVEDFEDLNNQKVRHHKFPSVRKMMTEFNNDGYGISHRDILGVEVNFPYSEFPSEILNRIESWELFYAERSEANTSIIGESSMLLYSEYWGGYDEVIKNNTRRDEDKAEYENKLLFTGGNQEVIGRDTGVSPNWRDEFIPTVNSTRYRMYNPDLLYSKSSSFPDYIEPLYILSKRISNDNNENEPEVLGPVNLDVGTETDKVLGLNAIMDGEGSTFPTVKFVLPRFVVDVTKSQYIPQNVMIGDINNRNSEEFIDVTTEYTISGYFAVPLIERTLIVIAKRVKKNIAIGFANQKLVSTGKVVLSGNSDVTIFGGDAFNSHYFYITHSNRLIRGNYNNTVDRTRFRYARTFISQGKLNLNFRYERIEEQGSLFYPVSRLDGDSTWFLLYNDDIIFNNLLYNLDYSSVNNINAIQIHDSSDRDHFVSEDNHKIIRSNIRKPEELTPSWRRFGANDYYIIPRNRGIITNIQGTGNALFTNTENSLFITSANEQLNVEGTTAVLGSGDIFGHSFRELVPDELGYSGCQHKFSCILTPLGYFFIDVEKKRVFLSDGASVKDINRGNNIFFQDNLTSELDNPFINEGYTVAWDEKYSRLILSKISGDKFTRSYYPMIESWFSRHSYFPSFMYNDRRDIYSLRDNIVYKHNEENYGVYYNEEIQPFHIVGVFNSGIEIDKILINTSWNTEVYLGEEYLKHKTFDSIMLWNRYQCSNEIPLIVFDSSTSLASNYKTSNTRRKKSVWNFNSFRDTVVNDRLPFIDNFNPIQSNLDISKQYFLKRRLIDTFFVYKLLFSNEKISNLQGEEISPKIEVLDISHQENIVRR